MAGWASRSTGRGSGSGMASYATQRTEVLGTTMGYVDVGSGPPIVLLHGNPTSSYLWRHVLPHLEGLGRCIAPDLVGMGSSDPLPDSGPGRYSFDTHRRHLDVLLEKLGGTEDVTLVVHDWGSGLGFDWANRHRGSVAGIAYMEAIVRPLTWEEFPADGREIFQAFRSPAGEELILQKNLFVEGVLPASVLRDLGPDLEVYREPYREPGERRRPMLDWPRQLPIDGEPAEVVQLVRSYADWLQESPVPKLFVDADPGSILVGAQREFCRSWPNQREVQVPGRHFLQEDSGDAIGRAVAQWIRDR
jgi:haloalkane dehalogenase